MENRNMEPFEKEHYEKVVSSAGECTVLLKTNGKFPLEAPGKIAAFGSGVRHTVKGGTGSGEVNSRFYIDIEQGLKDAGFTITTGSWLDAYDNILIEARKQFVKDIKAQAKAAHQNVLMFSMGKNMSEPDYELPLEADGDTAVYVVTRNSGEGADRTATAGDILLTPTEIRDILALDEKYERFMLVLNVGGVVDLSPVKDVSNILLLSQLGVVTGTVLADILLGKQNPSGKLTTTWAAWEDYCSIGDFGDPDDVHYNEGIYVGYRYFDSVQKKPLFPFGYGKSYTSFKVSPVDITADKDTITVKAGVVNSGDYAGKEVVQVYVSAPQGKLDKPYQELAGFEKTDIIEAGGSQVVSVSFHLHDLASYDEETASYVLEKGSYIVRVGNSCADTVPAGVLELEEAVTTLQAKNCLGDPGFKDWQPENIPSCEIPEDVKIIQIPASEIPARSVAYDAEYPVDDLIRGLSDEELAYMNIGYVNPKAKGLAVIGNAAPHVAGAAGESTSMFVSKGIPYMVMSDGPAGLRLARQYYVDEEGAHGIGSSMIPESMMEFATGLLGLLMKLVMGKGSKAPKGAQILEQYATAIPIGTSIAQSFNYDLAKMYGDIVGDEMERFGVQLWLAPALNIHRSIRCGRNFEYYSEDPFVSGMTAAAITEGVQAHAGRGTTIKHYAANNAETNRYANNSHVSERAMREIYLKGFGICVRKSRPHALMTSYNLLNGTHTSEHRGLTEDILRCEYGFRGIVMTDWVIAATVAKGSKYRGAVAAEVAKAGGDLFMPGCMDDYKSVLNALKDGSLSRDQVEINATRVLRMAKKLKG